MSCFVMAGHANGSYPAALSGMLPPSRAGHSIRFPRLPVFGIGPSSRSVFVPFSPPPRRTRRTLQMASPPGFPARRNPFPRVLRPPARASVRARFAPARFARLIAPVRPRASQTQDTRLPRFRRWFFCAGAGATGSGFRMPLPSLFVFYSNDAGPDCKPLRQEFLYFPAMRLICQE